MKRIFSKEVKTYIESNYKGVSPLEMTERVNRLFNTTYSSTQLQYFYNNNKLRSGIDSRFKKGNIPHNKGKKMSPEQYEKCKNTMFKKGSIPSGAKKLGETRISKDGYVLKKVTSHRQNNFKPLQRIIYEEAYGEIPKGHIVIFLDGDKTNLNLENLALISRREHVILNKRKLRFNDAERTRIGITIAKLMLKTNEKGVRK